MAMTLYIFTPYRRIPMAAFKMWPIWRRLIVGVASIGESIHVGVVVLVAQFVN